MTENPHVGVVVDLVDPYFTPVAKHAGGNKSTTPASEWAIQWLRAHPGRWALVALNNTGLTRQLLRQHPDIHATENRSPAMNADGNSRTYAQVPHPQGESLREALARRSIPGATALKLPELERDPFNWTKAELAEACQIARDNLFPVS